MAAMVCFITSHAVWCGMHAPDVGHERVLMR